MIFLGTGAADMIPDPFCACPLCQDARDHPEHVRLRSMVLLDEDNLIDFGPDLGAACAKYALNLSGLKRVFVTHTHQDHFCLANVGLVHMSRTREAPLDIYLSEAALDSLKQLYFPDEGNRPGIGKTADHLRKDVRFHPLRPGETYNCGDYRVLPVETTHHVSEYENGVNYLFEDHRGKKLLYGCDTGLYPPQTLSLLKNARVDVLILDATYGSGEVRNPRSHLNAAAFVRMLNILLENRTIRPDTAVFANHINHKHSFTQEDYQQWFDRNAPVKVTVARDGLQVPWKDPI